MTLSQLPVDLFFQLMTYLPFEKVKFLCSSNTQFHNYGINPRFLTKWKSLIDFTFSEVYNYSDLLSEIPANLQGKYNYLVYTRLIDKLDPVSQLIIYYRQNDLESFHSKKYTQEQRFLALFMSNQKTEIANCCKKLLIKSKYYHPFIDMLYGKTVSQKMLNRMAICLARKGSMKGLLLMIEKGASIRDIRDAVLSEVSKDGHLLVIKYLVEQGANIHLRGDEALQKASQYGNLPVVKFLIGKGSNVHADHDRALREASLYGHLPTVKYLIEQGANIHIMGDEPLVLASFNGHLPVVEYLIEQGADVHDMEDEPLISASLNGHLLIIKYLLEKGANIHARKDMALRSASEKGHLVVVKYLIEQGANIHANDEAALKVASLNGQIEDNEVSYRTGS